MTAATLTAPVTGFERVASALLLASLGLVMFNLLAAQTLFGLSAIMWLRVALADRAALQVPPFFWWLAAYGGLTIVSAFASIDPSVSLPDLKQLLLFAMVPMVMRLARGDRAMTALDVIIAMGAAGAVVGVIDAAAVRGIGDLQNRPQGSLTHYMTYSGVIMLVLCAVVARLVFYRRQWVWPAVAVPALAVALAVTMTRNAYIGAVVGIGVILAVRRLKLLLLLPVFVAVFFLLAPASLKNRALSSVDLQDPSNRDRLQMLTIGAEMIRDRPLTGVGPNMVIQLYPQYRPPDAVNPVNVHLHNVPLQIAAERGLPALAVWVGFVVVAAAGLVRQLRAGPARAVAGAGLAAIAAMLSAGLFEYNFGDSEFLMLFLGLITLPYAARLPTRAVGGAMAAHEDPGSAAEAPRPRPA
jgi:O-antigen ligase